MLQYYTDSAFELQPKKEKLKKLHLDISLFQDVQAEVVDSIPFDTDVTKIYHTNYKPEDWVKNSDGQWFKVNRGA